jgi:branched-subunit amino acid transport protein
MTAWIALLIASLLTLALRAGPSLINSGAVLPDILRRANRFTVPALMGALTTRGVAAHLHGPQALPTLAAVVIAVPVAVRTRSMSMTVAAGVAGQVLATWLIG